MSTGQHDSMAVQFEYSEYDDELYGGRGGYDDDDLDGGGNDNDEQHLEGLHDDRYAANDAAFEDGGESEGDADVAAAAAAEARALERAKQRQDAKPLSPRGAHVNHALVIADKPTQAVVVNVDMHGLPLPLQHSSSFASSPSAVISALAAAAAKHATPTSSTPTNETQQESRDRQGDKDADGGRDAEGQQVANDVRSKTTAEKKRAQPKPKTLTLGPYPSPSKQAQEAASQQPKTPTPTSTKTHTKVARSAKRSLSSPSSSKPRDGGPSTASKGDGKLGAKSSDGAPACAGVPTGPVVWSGSKPPRHRTPGARDEASRRLFLTESTAQRQPPDDGASISPRDPTSTEPYMPRTLPSIASKSTTPDIKSRAGLQSSSSALVVSDGRGAMTPPALSRTQTAQLAPRALTPAVLGGIGKTTVAPRSSTSLGERRKQAKIVVRRECFTPGLAPRSEPSLFTRAREAEEEEGYGDGGDDSGDDLAYLNSGMSKDVLSAVRSAVAAAGGEKTKSADPKTSWKKSNSGTAETPAKKRRSTTSAGTGGDTGLPLLDSPAPGTTLHPESRTGGGGNHDEELDWGSGNNNPTGGGGSRHQQASQEEREKQTRVTSAKAQQKTVLQDVLLRHGHSGTGNRATELTMFDLGPSDRAAQIGVPSLEKWPLRATSTKAPDALAQIDHRIATAKAQKEQFDQEQVRAARRLHPSTVSPAVSPRGSREPLHTPRRRAEIPPSYTSAGNSDVRSKGDASSSEPLVPVRNPVDKVIRQLEGARAPKRDASGGTLISAGGFAGGETSSASRLVPGFLDGISEWMRSELQTVPVSEGNEGVLRVCRLAFDQVIEQFTTYQPILGAIRGAYERRLDELEGEAETHLAIAEELQKERERFFASEAGAAIRINEANKRAEKMFNDMKDAEAQLVLTEDKVKDKQLQLQMERDTARLEAVQERAVRRDMEDNLKTYQRLYGEMKEKWSLAKDEVIEYRRSVESQLMSLTREREALLADRELTARRTQSEKLDLQVMIDQLATHSLTPEKMAEFNAQRESTKQSIANLQSKIEWLERELETKSEHEPRVNWDELDAEFGAWRSEGLTSHEVANRVVRRLNRLQRKYDTAATVASRVQPLTELFGGADLCAAALDFADNDVASRRWAGPNAGAPTFISTNQGAHNAANAEQLFAQNGGYSAHSLMLRRAVLISLGYDIQDPRFSSLTSMISIGKELFSKSYLKAASGALLELEAGAGRRASPQRASANAGAVSASAIGNANGGEGPRRSTAARQSSTTAAPSSSRRGPEGTSPLRTTTAGGGGAVRALDQSGDIDDEGSALAKAGLIKKETPNERERRLTLEKEQHRVEALLKEERDFVTKLHEPVQEDLTEGTHPYVPPHWRSRVSAQFVPPSTKDHFTVRSMMACALVTMAAARIPSIHLALEAIWKKSFLPQFAQPLQFGIFGRCLVRRLHQTFAADPFLGDFCVSLLDGSRPAAAHAHQILLQLRFAVRTFTDVERAITGATQTVSGVGTAAGPAHPGPFGQPPVVPAGLAALNIGTHVTSMTNINAGGAAGANGAAGVGSGGGFTPQLSLAAATAAAAFSGGSGATTTNASHALGSGNALSAMAHSPLAASVGASVASEGRSSVAESRPKLTGFLPKAIFLDAMASAFPLKPGYDIVALKHALYVQHSGCAPFVAELQKAAALGHNTPSTNAGPKKKTPGQRGAGAGNRGVGGRGGTTGASTGPPQGSGGAMIGQAAKLWHQVAHVNYGNPFHLFGSIAEGHMSPLLEALVCEQYPRDVLTAEAHIFSMLVNSSEEYYGRSFVTASKMKKAVSDFITTPGIAAKLILRVEPNPVAPAIAMGVEDEGFMRPMHLKGRLSSVQSLASSVGKGGARRPSTTPSGFSETMETVDSDDESKQNSQQVTARGGGDGKNAPGTDTKGKEKDGDKKDKKKHDPRGRPPPGPKPVRRPGDKRTGGAGPGKEDTAAQPQEELSPHEEALRALRAAELQQQHAVAAAVEASAPKVALLIASALQVPDSLGLFGRPPFGEDAVGPSDASPTESPTKASEQDTKSAAEDPANRSLKDGAVSVVGDSKTAPDVGGQKARHSVNSTSDAEQTQHSQPAGAQQLNKPRSTSQQPSSGGLISSPTGDGIVPPALSAFSVMHGASVLSVASNDSGDGGRGGGGGGGGASARRSLRLPYSVDGAWSDHFLPDVPPRGSAGFEDSIVHIRTDDLPSALWSDTPLKTHLCQSFRPETAPLGIDKKGNIVGMHKGTERDISQSSRPTSPLASPFRSPTSFSSPRHSANPTVAALSMSMSQRSPTQGGAAGTNAGTQRGSESRQGQGQSQVGQGSAPTSPVQAIPVGDLMVQSPQDAGLASPDAKSGVGGAGGAAPNGGSSHSLLRSGSGHSGAGAASEKSPPRAEMVGTLPPPKAAPPRAILEPLCGVVDALDAIRSLLPLSSPLLVRLAVGSYNVPVPAVFGPCGEEYTKGVGLAHGLMYDAPGTWSRQHADPSSAQNQSK